jgi:hypothetical protein
LVLKSPGKLDLLSWLSVAYVERRKRVMHPSLIKKLADQLIAERLREAERTVNSVRAQIHPDLIDEMIELYCQWRTACAEVQGAYERFLAASPSDQVGAFAAYTAALDREEAACTFYANQVRLIESRCTAANTRTRRCATGRTEHSSSRTEHSSSRTDHSSSRTNHSSSRTDNSF